MKSYPLTNFKRRWFKCLFIFLIFTVSVETYGLGNQRNSERFDQVSRNELPYSNQQINNSNTNVLIQKTEKETSKPEEIGARKTIRNMKRNNEHKRLLESSELGTMHRQSKREKKRNNNLEFLKSHGLLNQIEKQIHLREMHQRQNKRRNHMHSVQKRFGIPSKVMHKTFYPKQELIQRSFDNQINPRTIEERNNLLKLRGLQTGTSKQLFPGGFYQQNFKQSAPLSLLNGMKISAAPQHVLIPLSAFASGNASNGKVLLPRRYSVSYQGSKARIGPTEETRRIAPKRQLSSPVQSQSTINSTITTESTRSTSSTTTVRPMVSFLTTSSYSRVHSLTTSMDFETLKMKYMERAIKKQDLEITKLKLEIRFLQREENQSVSEKENDDAHQPHRGKFGLTKHMFPYNR